MIGDYSLPWWGLKLGAEVSYIGPRTTSFSNALIEPGFGGLDVPAQGVTVFLTLVQGL